MNIFEFVGVSIIIGLILGLLGYQFDLPTWFAACAVWIINDGVKEYRREGKIKL